MPSLLGAQVIDTNWQKFILNSPNTGMLAVTQQQTENEGPNQSSQAKVEHLKSVKKAFLISAILPGTGELYSGSYFKAAAFIAIEIGAWTTYSMYYGKGKDIESEFHDYADQHWIEDEYWDYISQQSGINRNDMEALRDWEQGEFSHGLHREKDQQYYEMIGKYDQFNYGWDDTDKGLRDPEWDISMRSKNRLYYEDRRDASNKAFKAATWGTMIALVNHALSAVDAAWTAHQHNKTVLHTSIRMQPQKYGYEVEFIPTFSLSIDW